LFSSVIILIDNKFGAFKHDFGSLNQNGHIGPLQIVISKFGVNDASNKGGGESNKIMFQKDKMESEKK
jgi:hypothetical protein